MRRTITDQRQLGLCVRVCAECCARCVAPSHAYGCHHDLRYSRERYGCCCLRADVMSVTHDILGGGPCMPFPPEVNEAGQTPPPTWPYMSAADATVWCPDEQATAAASATTTSPPAFDTTTSPPAFDTTTSQPSSSSSASSAGGTTTSVESAATPPASSFVELWSSASLLRGQSGSSSARGVAAHARSRGQQQSLAVEEEGLARMLGGATSVSPGTNSSLSACKFFPGLGGGGGGAGGGGGGGGGRGAGAGAGAGGGRRRRRARGGDCSNDCYTLKSPQQRYADTLKGVAVILHDEAESLCVAAAAVRLTRPAVAAVAPRCACCCSHWLMAL